MNDLDIIVNDYVTKHRVRARHELEWYEGLETDVEAASRAAWAETEDEKRHCHQRRIPRAVLEESRIALLDILPELKKCECFDELISLVERVSGSIKGIGELTVYDTALRLGARFGHAPEQVYLHAGTRTGAQALGFDGRRRAIAVDELPAAFSALSAREAEDALCIYEDELRGGTRSTAGCALITKQKRGCSKPPDQLPELD